MNFMGLTHHKAQVEVEGYREHNIYEDYKAYEREGSFTNSLRVRGTLRLLLSAK
jgi:hypothetical protein